MEIRDGDDGCEDLQMHNFDLDYTLTVWKDDSRPPYLSTIQMVYNTHNTAVDNNTNVNINILFVHDKIVNFKWPSQKRHKT